MANTLSVTIPLRAEQLQALQEVAAQEHRNPEDVGAEILAAGLSARTKVEMRNGVNGNRSGLTNPKVDLGKLLRHAGAVSLGKPTGLDNDEIDADLAKEYAGRISPDAARHVGASGLLSQG